MPAMVAMTILGSQCSSLTELRIEAECVGLAGAGLGALVTLTRLRSLRCDGLDT